MSKFKYITNLVETELDDDNNAICDYETNLPHHDVIIKEICKSWNDMHMEQYYDGCLKDKIHSAVMSAYRDKNHSDKCMVEITFVLKNGCRLTETCRDAIIDQTNAQFTDGWGESFFGYGNIMTDGGKRFIVE